MSVDVGAILREESSLRSYALRLLGNDHDARECVQDVIVKACESRSAPDQWRPWLFRLTHHAAVDRLRRKGAEGRALRVVGRRPTEVFDVSPDLLEEMLAGLPTEPRAILLLRFAHGLSFSEIADILGRPAATLQVYAGRALAQLHEKLSREKADELR
jgi:RNA polymerase sigma-70 factor, ECF subfamily